MQDLQKRVQPTKTEWSLYGGKGYLKYVDHMGNDLTPLVAARMSTLNPTGVDAKKDDALRKMLWRHGHHSVFEQAVVSIEVQVPIFVARQLLRHRTLSPNEHSQRYAEPIDLYYSPKWEDIKSQSEVDKQGSDGEVEDWAREQFILEADEQQDLMSAKYHKHNKVGKISREMTRIFQPVSSMTRLYITGKLRNWLDFLRLRKAPDAQKEIRDLADALFELISELYPKCASLFEEYTLRGASFGRSELDFIGQILDRIGVSLESLPEDWSARDKREFLQKLGLSK